jgi:hypothetical protein
MLVLVAVVLVAVVLMEVQVDQVLVVLVYNYLPLGMLQQLDMLTVTVDIMVVEELVEIKITKLVVQQE